MAIFISHRGESKDAPENTLEAFRLSNERDSDGMETDIHFTLDRVLVCSHDSDTKRRACGYSTIIEETLFSDLEKINVSGEPDSYDGKYPETHIPRFSDSLKTLRPGRKYYVEIKQNDPTILPAMKEEIDRSGVSWDQIVVISFHADIIAESRKQMPNIPALWLVWHGDKVNWTQTHSQEELIATLDRIHATGLDVGGEDCYLTKDFFDELKRRGYFIAVWTIDTEDRCRYLIANGADAVTSNCAAAMKAVCR